MTTPRSDPAGRSRQRIALVSAALATAPVWYALTRITTYDRTTYYALSGYQASGGTWAVLAAVTVATLAIAWFATARRWLILAVAASLVASVVTVRMAIHARTPPDPIAAESPDCTNLNIGFGCEIHRFLDWFERPDPDPAAFARLRRPINIATGASIASFLLFGFAGARRRPRA